MMFFLLKAPFSSVEPSFQHATGDVVYYRTNGCGQLVFPPFYLLCANLLCEHYDSGIYLYKNHLCCTCHYAMPISYFMY